MWGAIILGILSVLGSLGGAALQKRNNEQIYQQQKQDSLDFYDMQLQDNKELMQDSREYNSESAQADRLMAAGKNPDLVDFSGSTTASASAPAAQVPVEPSMDYGTVMSCMTNAIQSTVGTMKSIQDLRNMQTQGEILESDSDSRILSLANQFPELSKTFLQSLNKKSLDYLILHGNKDLSKVGFQQFADQFVRYGKLSDETRGAFFDYFNDFINSEEGQSYMIGLKNKNISTTTDFQKVSNDPMYSAYGTVSRCAIDFMKASYDAMQEAEKEKFKFSRFNNMTLDYANTPKPDADPYYQLLGGSLQGAAKARLTRDLLMQKVDELFRKEIENQNLTGATFYMNLYNDLMNGNGSATSFGKTMVQSMFGINGPLSKLMDRFNSGMEAIGL